MQEKIEGMHLRDLHDYDRSRYVEREKELVNYRELIQNQERELDSYRSKLKKEHFLREREIQKEVESREKSFSDREKQLFERQRSFENKYTHMQEEVANLRHHLEMEVSEREARLNQGFLELQQEKERYNIENRKKIEATSKDYVSDALSTLDAKEKEFHYLSKIWSFVGAGSLFSGLILFTVVTLFSVISFPAIITWEFIVFSLFKGVVALTIIAGLAKYAFMFSNSYMRESLKNADRRHAINFGKFYLESYGAAAEWSQVKDAFEHWNITGENAFSPRNEESIDISLFEKLTSIIERASKVIPISSLK